MQAAIPVVEVSDHGNASRVGSPDGEMHAIGTVMVHGMGTEFVIEAEVVAFADVVVIHGAEYGTERIGIGHDPFAACIGAGETDGVLACSCDRPFKKSGIMAAFNLAKRRAVQRLNNDVFGTGYKGAGDPLLAGFVQAEHGKRVAVAALCQGHNGRCACCPSGLFRHVLPLPYAVCAACYDSGLWPHQPLTVQFTGRPQISRA